MARDLGTRITQIECSCPIEVRHQDCSQAHLSDATVTVFAGTAAESIDTLTRIAVSDGRGEQVLHVYWFADAGRVEQFHILHLEPSSRVFFGAGEFFAIWDYAAGAVVGEERVFDFRGFGYERGCVVVRSELDCFLYKLDGVQLGQVPVDPPWEESVTGQGIEFNSQMYGRQLLRWPESALTDDS